MDKIPKQDEVIILGDFSGRIGNEIISGIKNQFNKETQWKKAYRIYNNSNIFLTTPGDKSILDYIITNRNILTIKILLLMQES